jgi:hypothetical protein
MRTLIAGSRDIKEKEVVFSAIKSAKDRGFEITEIVSGTSEGVDRLGEKWAETNDVDLKRFPYEDYLEEHNPKVAPLIRNSEMAEYADQAIIVWNGDSNGTEDMIEKVQEKGIDLYLERTDNKSIEDFS